MGYIGDKGIEPIRFDDLAHELHHQLIITFHLLFNSLNELIVGFYRYTIRST